LDFEHVKLISREDLSEIARRSGVEHGDVLFAMIGTVGNPVVVETDREFAIKNVGLFKGNRDFVVSRYLRYWFMSPQFARWLEPKQKGTTQKFVPLGLLRSLAIALPPFTEQQMIVAEVERRLSVIEELEAAVQASLTRADRLRQSILSTAFSGRLAVSELEIARRANKLIAH
jgi:type I restriction enzyme S subunit